MSPDRDAIEYLAGEWGIDPAFIEKDWHAVRVLQALSTYRKDGSTVIFTGGTSLSKGYNLLKRFSEDLDFRTSFDHAGSGNQLKKKRSAFREEILDILDRVDGLSFNRDRDLDLSGLGFKVDLSYSKEFDAPDGMRPALQIEFSYSEPRLESEHRPISSFVAAYKSDPPETAFLCLSPVEIAADKFSSFIWRVHKRNRSDRKDDPAMVRHLHDLCALQEHIANSEEEFARTAANSFKSDQQLEIRRIDMPLAEAALEAHRVICEDMQYAQEYEQFVSAMSYADEREQIPFDQASVHFREITNLIS